MFYNIKYKYLRNVELHTHFHTLIRKTHTNDTENQEKF